MAADWTDLVDHVHDVIGDVITVHVGRGRRHDVWVLECEDGCELAGYVGDASLLIDSGLSIVDLWIRNRTMRLAQYAVDAVGDVWVSSWAPSAGITSQDFEVLLRHVAAEADRLEYLLTGQDAH